LRSYWRLELDYDVSDWAIGLAANGAYRRGQWHDLERATSDRSLMLMMTFGI
jgi:hypothetical protein